MPLPAWRRRSLPRGACHHEGTPFLFPRQDAEAPFNGMGIRMVRNKENYIFMEGGAITGGNGLAVLQGSGGTMNKSVGGEAGFNAMSFQLAETGLTFSSDLKNFNFINVQGSPLPRKPPLSWEIRPSPWIKLP